MDTEFQRSRGVENNADISVLSKLTSITYGREGEFDWSCTITF